MGELGTCGLLTRREWSGVPAVTRGLRSEQGTARAARLARAFLSWSAAQRNQAGFVVGVSSTGLGSDYAGDAIRSGL